MTKTQERLNIRMELSKQEYADLKARHIDFRPTIKETAFICEMVDRAYNNPETLVRGLGIMIDPKRDTGEMVHRDFRMPEESAKQLRKMKEVSGLALHHLLPMIVLDTVYKYSPEMLEKFLMRPTTEESMDYLTWFSKASGEAEAVQDPEVTLNVTPQVEAVKSTQGEEYADAETAARIAQEETEFRERYNTVRDHNGLTAAERDQLTAGELASLPAKPVEIAPENLRQYKEPNPFGSDTYDVSKFSNKTLTLEQRRQHALDHGYNLNEDEQPTNNESTKEDET